MSANFDSGFGAAPLLLRTARLLAGTLLGFYLVLANRMSFEDLRFGMMGAVALVGIAWTNPDRVAKEISIGSVVAGGLLLGFTLWRVHGQAGELAASLAPFPLGFGLALLIGGWKNLPKFWREGIVIAGLAISPFVETVLLEIVGFDPAPSTARFTAGLLRLGGWQSSARDVIVTLPNAWVVVSQGCSGLKTTYFLVGFAAVVLLLYPLPGSARKLVVLLGAAAIGYAVNSIRVAILALLATPGHEQAFVFWHIKQGAMVFEVIAVIVFLTFVYFLMPTRRLRVDAEG